MHQAELLQLYQEHREKLFACALAVTLQPDLAEEAMQEAFCNLAQPWIQPERILPYAYQCIRNCATSLLRKNKKRNLELAEFALFVAPNPRQDDGGADCLDRERLAAGLARLRADERQTVFLHVFGGFTFTEIAELFDCSIHTANARCRRGLAKLKARLRR
jgi:RNA polymerase sigma-70 factor (ECF subfamily)